MHQRTRHGKTPQPSRCIKRCCNRLSPTTQHLECLRRAYVDTCYSKNYGITESELTAVAERIPQHKAVTADACEKKIEALEKAVAEEGKQGKV